MNLFSHIPMLADTAANNGGTTIYMLVMIAALVLVFYFVMYRPQKKQEKETTAMRNGLTVGDEITTIGGIIGKIVSIKGDTCMIETGKDRTKIRILKSAIKSVDVPASIAGGGAIPVDTAADEKKEKEKEKESAEASDEKPAETEDAPKSKKKKK